MKIKQITGMQSLDDMLEKFTVQRINKKNLEKEVAEVELRLNDAKRMITKSEQVILFFITFNDQINVFILYLLFRHFKKEKVQVLVAVKIIVTQQIMLKQRFKKQEIYTRLIFFFLTSHYCHCYYIIIIMMINLDTVDNKSWFRSFTCSINCITTRCTWFITKSTTIFNIG